MPRQHSFRCLDAVLAEPDAHPQTPPPHSPSATSSPSTPTVPGLEIKGARETNTHRGGNKFKQLFRKKTPSPQPVPERESFFCADAQALEEAFQSSRDRYEGASLKASTGFAPPAHMGFGHGAIPAPIAMAKEPPARNFMAEALAQRARAGAGAGVSDQRLSPPANSHLAPARPARRFVPPTTPPPVPPLPEQYRRREMAPRV